MDKEEKIERKDYEKSEETIYDFSKRNEKIQQRMWESFRGNKASGIFVEMEERLREYKAKISTCFENKYDELEQEEAKLVQEEEKKADSTKEENDN